MRGDDLDGQQLRDVVRKRTDVLASICETPARKPELVDRLDVSRSTVDRAVDALVEAGLIRRVDGDYCVTPHGRLALEAHQEYVSSTDRFAEAAPLLATLPVETTINRSLLEHGTIRVAEPHAPENAITEAVRELKSAEQLLVFSPVVKSSYVRLVHEQVAERGLEVTLVLEAGASESLASLADVTESVEHLLASESFSLYATDRELPFLLYLMLGEESDTVGLTVHEDGGLVGSVVADDPDAVAWGRAWFDDVLADADQQLASSLL